MNIIVNTTDKFTANHRNFFQEVDFFPAQKAFDAIAPYISHAYWGINKKHTITKAEFVARSKWCEARNQGIEKPKIPILDERGVQWIRNDGKPVFFNYHLNYKQKIWTPEAISPCIDGEELHYYMSPARAGKKMGYLDLDAHDPWQDDLDDAIDLVKELFGDNPFWRSSHRGYNGWLKIGDAPSAKAYNIGLARMEKVLRDAFAQLKIKTSIEVKGRSVWTPQIESFLDRRSHLAKLPYWNHRYPCNQKDEDDVWNHRRQREFESKPDISWSSLMAGIDQLEQKLDPARVEEGRRYLKAMKSGEPIIIATEPAEEESEATASSGTAAEAAVMPPPAAADMSEKPPVLAPQGRPETLEHIREIDDAFVRDREFALYACRLARRPLSAEELLDQDRLNHIYHGKWEDGLANRARRYQQIAPFVAQTFDVEKCGKPSQRPILDENIGNWIARAYLLPKEAIGYVGQRALKFDRQVLLHLAAIIQTASQKNGDCPRDSIQGWWEELATEDKLPAWNTDLYTAARWVLLKHKIVAIDNGRYQFVPDAKGRCKGIWIREQESGGGSSYIYPSNYLFISTHLHNGYDVDMQVENSWEEAFAGSRAPP